jgi:hypothetical protein
MLFCIGESRWRNLSINSGSSVHLEGAGGVKRGLGLARTASWAFSGGNDLYRYWSRLKRKGLKSQSLKVSREGANTIFETGTLNRLQ